MVNKSEFMVCRACLISSDVTNSYDLFGDNEEIMKKFQEVSNIDISQDKNKYQALICKHCKALVEAAFETGKRIRGIEKNFISILRAKIDKENRGKESMKVGEGVKVAVEEKAGILKVSKNIENKTIETATMKDDFPDDELVMKIEVVEKKFQKFTKVNNTISVERATIEAAMVVDEDGPDTIDKLYEEIDGNDKSSSSHEEIEDDHEAQKMLETEDDVVAPLALSSEYTIEEITGLNLKEPKVFLEKVNMSETEDFHEIKVEDHQVIQTQEQPVGVCDIKGRNHMLVHSFSNDTTENSNRPFKCSFEGCEKFFKMKHHLKNHEETHNLERMKCLICSKDYANKRSLQVHISFCHRRKNIFKFDRCPKTFMQKRPFLNNFRRNHIQKKSSKTSAVSPNLCKICFKLFSSRSSLKVHIESVHEKKCKFICDLCSKTFYDKRNLRNHMATHIYVNNDTTNSDRPHRCNFKGCGKYFKLKKDLKDHNKQVHW